MYDDWRELIEIEQEVQYKCPLCLEYECVCKNWTEEELREFLGEPI